MSEEPKTLGQLIQEQIELHNFTQKLFAIAQAFEMSFRNDKEEYRKQLDGYVAAMRDRSAALGGMGPALDYYTEEASITPFEFLGYMAAFVEIGQTEIKAQQEELRKRGESSELN